MAKRIWIAAAALVLAACGEPAAPGAGGESNADAGGVLSAIFPDLFSASYRAEGVVTDPNSGRQMPVTQIRSGKLMRIEFSDPSSGAAGATVINSETQEAFTITEVGGQRMAMRISMDQASTPGTGADFDADSVERVGACSAAGESGTEWRSTEEGATAAACVTSDGILLRSTHDGQTVWETTSVSRGPQDPALFTIPPGVPVMDLGSVAAGLQQMREKMGQ